MPNWRVRVVRKSHQYAEISVCAKSEEEAKKTAKRILSGETRGWKSIYVDYDVTIIPKTKPKMFMAKIRWSLDKTPLHEERAVNHLSKSICQAEDDRVLNEIKELARRRSKCRKSKALSRRRG